MNIKEITLSLSQCARILKVPRIGATYAADLGNWPGRPSKKTKPWKVPASWLQEQFQVTEARIAAELKGGAK